MLKDSGLYDVTFQYSFLQIYFLDYFDFPRLFKNEFILCKVYILYPKYAY